jgi:NADH-quinone oxidoreductase subunit J
MTFQQITFYFFAALMVFSGIRVITARNPVHAALFLVLAFFTASATWMLLYAEFLAITLVLVYVGAVMVLFLFVVMMLDINFDKLREGFWSYLPVAGTVGVLMAIEMALVLTHRNSAVSSMGKVPPAGYSNTKAIGLELFTKYLYLFELAAVLLVVAIIAAIALTLRPKRDNKSVDPSKQIYVKASDRLKVVKVAPATPNPDPVVAADDVATAATAEPASNAAAPAAVPKAS